MKWLNDLLEFLEYDFTEFLNRISSFFDTVSTEVMNNEMVGLIMYLFGCIPVFIRYWMTVVIIFAVILSLKELLFKN